MQRLTPLLFLAVAICLTACRTLPPVAPGAYPHNVSVQEVRVAFVSGNAVCWNEAGEGNIEPGRILKPGDTISTGPDSYVDFEHRGYYAVRIKPNTQFQIQKLDFIQEGSGEVMNVQLEVRTGDIVCDVVSKRLSAASKFEIKNALGILGVRGSTETVFSLSSGGGCSVAKGEILAVFVINGVPRSPVTQLIAGQSLSPAETPAGEVKIFTTPLKVARTLAKDWKELKKHCVLK